MLFHSFNFQGELTTFAFWRKASHNIINRVNFYSEFHCNFWGPFPSNILLSTTGKKHSLLYSSLKIIFDFNPQFIIKVKARIFSCFFLFFSEEGFLTFRVYQFRLFKFSPNRWSAAFYIPFQFQLQKCLYIFCNYLADSGLVIEYSNMDI